MYENNFRTIRVYEKVDKTYLFLEQGSVLHVLEHHLTQGNCCYLFLACGLPHQNKLCVQLMLVDLRSKNTLESIVQSRHSPPFTAWRAKCNAWRMCWISICKLAQLRDAWTKSIYVLCNKACTYIPDQAHMGMNHMRTLVHLNGSRDCDCVDNISTWIWSMCHRQHLFHELLGAQSKWTAQ